MQFKLPCPEGTPITQNFSEHVQRAKKNGWCSKPGNCPGGIWYYGGLDLGGKFPVTNPADGQVNKIKTEYKGYGHCVYIDHGDGYLSILAHLQPGSIAVQPGQQIKVNAPIAISDNTGNSTGDHLHWEVRKDGYPIDPVPLLGTDVIEPLPAEPAFTPLPGGLVRVIADELNQRATPFYPDGKIRGKLYAGAEIKIEQEFESNTGYIWRRLTGQELYVAEYSLGTSERYLEAV